MSAAPTISLVHGPSPTVTSSSTFPKDELFFSRRALTLLKSRLGTSGLLTLLAPDIALADTYWRGVLSRSNNQYTHLASVTLTCTGLTTSSFLAWFKQNVHDIGVMQAAHPEHYINGLTVLETVGEHVSLFDLVFVDDALLDTDVVQNRDRAKYPIALCARGVLRGGNGEVVGHACHQFRDVEGGLEACFSGWLPAGVDEQTVETQRRHLNVEWSNWLTAAWNDSRS